MTAPQWAAAARANVTHGMTNTRTFRTWTAMKARCSNPRTIGWSRYGGRGITVCQQWRDSFVAFLADMGEAPAGMELDRRDNDGDYTPENCRWVTPKENSNNRRTTHALTFDGRTQSLTAWAAEIGVTPQGLRARIVKHSWPIEKALTQRSRQA